MEIRRYYSRLLAQGKGNNPSLFEATRDLEAALAQLKLRDLNG